jgi:hypothetical protein
MAVPDVAGAIDNRHRRAGADTPATQPAAAPPDISVFSSSSGWVLSCTRALAASRRSVFISGLRRPKGKRILPFDFVRLRGVLKDPRDDRDAAPPTVNPRFLPRGSAISAASPRGWSARAAIEDEGQPAMRLRHNYAPALCGSVATLLGLIGTIPA